MTSLYSRAVVSNSVTKLAKNEDNVKMLIDTYIIHMQNLTPESNHSSKISMIQNSFISFKARVSFEAVGQYLSHSQPQSVVSSQLCSC